MINNNERRNKNVIYNIVFNKLNVSINYQVNKIILNYHQMII